VATVKKFCVCINGQNFLVDMYGKVAKRGFFKSFYLEATSPEQAENMAVGKLKEDNDLHEITKNPKSDPPVRGWKSWASWQASTKWKPWKPAKFDMPKSGGGNFGNDILEKQS